MKIWHEVWDYVKMIIIVVAVVLVVNNVVLINAKIPSESMEKTIMTGVTWWLWILKLTTVGKRC